MTGEPIAGGRRRQLVRYLSDPLVGRLRAFHHGESRRAPRRRSAARGRRSTLPGSRSWPATAPTEVTPDDVTDLRVGVAKADIHTVDLSYAPAEGGVEQFGLWHQLDVADQAALRPVIENGGHWMFSARAPVQLVHAVRRPLLAPRIAPSGDDPRRVAPADALDRRDVHDHVEIERRSTGRLTLDARWVDLVDDLRADGPNRAVAVRRSAASSPPATSTSPPTFEIADHRAELGDTRRHAATIDLEAFSSFSAYFTEERAGEIDHATPTVIDRRGFAKATVQVIGADGTTATEGVDYVVDHAKGAIAALPRGRFARRRRGHRPLRAAAGQPHEQRARHRAVRVRVPEHQGAAAADGRRGRPGVLPPAHDGRRRR